MLARPMIASDQLATEGGRPHRLTSPGRCVTRKAIWKPQVKIRHAAIDSCGRRAPHRRCGRKPLSMAWATLCRESSGCDTTRVRGKAASTTAASAHIDPIQPIALDQLLQDGRENKLPERSTGIDDAGRRTARLDRQTCRRRTNQYREAASAGTDGGKQTEGEDQPPGAAHERRQGAAQWRSRSKPPCKTRRGPKRSATAPASGCTAPQVN